MLVLRDDQQTDVQFSFLDKKGKPTTAENVVLTSSDVDVLAVTDNGGGSFTVVAGKIGTAQLQASADARIGDGEVIVTGTETVQVVAGEAAVVTISLGEPVDQP